MTEQDAAASISRHGSPAIAARIFGWLVLATLAAFLINNVLIVGFGFPAASSIFSGGGGAAFVTLGVYLAGFVLAVLYVLRTPDQALRWDAHRVHSFNLFLIRACFWSVLLVGITDATIAFMRVEKLLAIFVSDEMVRSLSLSRYVGVYVHIPLIVLGFVIALFTRSVAFVWLALMIVGAELAIVISRFVFSYEQALMGDLVRYWYAALFLFASAYTLYEDGHVRVDVLYAGFKGTTRGFVNAIGSILLGMSTVAVIIWIGFNGKQSIINAPVMNFEISQSAAVGMFIKYQMAAFLAIFAITMLIQFVSYFFEAVADRRDEPGHRAAAPVSH